MARKPLPLRPQLPSKGDAVAKDRAAPPPSGGGAAAKDRAAPPPSRGGAAAKDRAAPPPPPSHRKPTLDTPAKRSPRKAKAARSAREELPSVQIDDVLDGKYLLLEQLDEGGMGQVFVAHNQALDVPVAVKVIRSDVKEASKETLGERLLQEARAAARLGHPAIVRMLDFGIAPNGDPYLVMELLDGEDLAGALDQRGRVNPAKAVRLLLPIAHALAAAHDKGIVHRDLKPDNIILAHNETGQIQPKLIDFGIAKLHHPKQRRLTMMGDALGTPEYMSPQQARGEDVDAAADIWALSVLLYEMITGMLPFDGINYHALLRAIIEDEPEPISNLGVQADALWQIIAKGLAKKSADRWSSMRELGAALAQWLIDQGVSEDICGASLNATWLRSPSYDAVDVLSSVPPPAKVAKASLSAPAVEITGFAPDSIDEELPSSADAEPSLRDRPTDPSTPLPDVKSEESVESSAVDAFEVIDQESADEGHEAPAREPRPPATRRSWTAIGLWLLTLTGVAWAVTGYLGVSLPGLPARMATPAWLADLLGAAPSTAAPPALPLSTAPTAEPTVEPGAELATTAEDAGDEPQDAAADGAGGAEPTDADAAAGGASSSSAEAAGSAPAAAVPNRPPPRHRPPPRQRKYYPSEL